MKLKKMKVQKGHFTGVVRTHFYVSYEDSVGSWEFCRINKWCIKRLKDKYELGHGSDYGHNFYIDCPKSVMMFELRYGHLF